ncbi:MAG: Ig domain-containing protein, partial [Chloroflexota bacterium]
MQRVHTPRLLGLAGLMAAMLFVVTMAPALAGTVISTTSLPQGQVGVAYSQMLVAANGTAPYTWSNPSGTLPAGLTLTSTGAINGMPTSAGTSTFAVQATDGVGAVATQVLSISIASSGALTVTVSALPAGQVGTVYAQTLMASGGTLPYT